MTNKRQWLKLKSCRYWDQPQRQDSSVKDTRKRLTRRFRRQNKQGEALTVMAGTMGYYY